MDGNHVVLDISSDEDVIFDWASTEGRDNDNDNFDWNNLLVTAKDQNCDDKGYDSDDVVFVREVLPDPKRAKKVAKLVPQDLEDDDDCVILDGDPDKIAGVEDSGPNYDADSDDLVIVGEKGQVACRDYPHPRHLCVNFPFNSTLHSDYCKLCHCYVCDSPAPCGHWGNGNLMIDHCHANDKEELWNSERKRVKLEKSAPVTNSTDASFWRALLKQIPTPPPSLAQNSGSLLPGQAPSFGMPNIIRSQRAVGVSARHSNHLTRQQFNPCSNNPLRPRATNLSYVSHTPTFKRTACPSFNSYKKTYSSNLADIRRASSQANVRHLHEFNMGFINGPVYSNTLQSSSGLSASQVASPPTLAQGQADQCSQPCPQSFTPVSSTVDGNASHVQAEQQFPLVEQKPSNEMNPDIYNLAADTQFINDLPPFDFEDVQLVYDMDQLWPLL